MATLVALAGLIVSLGLNLLMYRTWRRAYEDGRAMGRKEGYDEGTTKEGEKWRKMFGSHIEPDSALLDGLRDKGKPEWAGPPKPTGHGSTVAELYGND